MKQVPTPGSVSSSMQPPCSSTSRLIRYRPKPRPPLRGESFVPDVGQDVGGDAAAGVLADHQIAVRAAVHGQLDLPHLAVASAELVDGVFQQVAQDGGIVLRGEEQVLLPAEAVVGYGEQDAQLGGVHHLPDDEGAQVGHPDTVRRLPDGLAGDQTGVHDELDSFLALAGLEIAQDDVELVHELVVEKAQGVQHVAGTGELVGQLAHLRLVVEDVEHPWEPFSPRMGTSLARIWRSWMTQERLCTACPLRATWMQPVSGKKRVSGCPSRGWSRTGAGSGPGRWQRPPAPAGRWPPGRPRWS